MWIIIQSNLFEEILPIVVGGVGEGMVCQFVMPLCSCLRWIKEEFTSLSQIPVQFFMKKGCWNRQRGGMCMRQPNNQPHFLNWCLQCFSGMSASDTSFPMLRPMSSLNQVTGLYIHYMQRHTYLHTVQTFLKNGAHLTHAPLWMSEFLFSEFWTGLLQ